MIPAKQCDRLIMDILKYLETEQQASGSFLDSLGHENVFYTALIMQCLERCIGDSAAGIKNRAAEYLLRTQESDGTWRYNHSLPPDMDDTCVILRALHAHTETIPSIETLADMVKLLIHQEAAPGGPYHTWIVSDHAAPWDDIDTVVNSNIAAFLDAIGIENRVLHQYLHDAIVRDRVHSHYYDHAIAACYFLSQSSSATSGTALSDTIYNGQMPDGSWGSTLHTALAMTSLIRLGENPKTLAVPVSFLVNGITASDWFDQPLFIESTNGDAITKCACPAFVAASCVEALVLCVTERPGASLDDSSPEKIFISTVHACCMEKIPDILKGDLAHCLKKLAEHDPSHEIELLSYHVAQHLKNGTAIPPEDSIACAVANTFGWIGYTLYDKLIDGEPVVALQPLAHLCVQHAQSMFYTLLPAPYRQLAERIFTDIVTATAWEYAHCKTQLKNGMVLPPEHLPNYGDLAVLAKKSFGHALGPLALYCKSGQSDALPTIETFFKHYLIAKQLHDDAHDWQEDLEHGFINSVSASLLQVCPSRMLTALREYFWQTHIDSVSSTIVSHIAMARTALQGLSTHASLSFFETLLVPLEQSALQAVQERDKTKALLKALTG